jgi:ribosomal protein S27E
VSDEKTTQERAARRHERLKALHQFVRLCPRCGREWIVLGGGGQRGHACKACGATLLVSKQIERSH